MATRDAVFRIRSEFDASGTQAAVDASGKVTQATGQESKAFEGASESALHLEVSKRRLIRTTAALTGDVAMMATRGAGMGTILNTAGTSVMFLTHSLGSLAGPLGIALLLAGAAVEGYLHFAEKQETAAEKAEKLTNALEEAHKTMEKARDAFRAGLFSPEQLAAIEAYARNLEKQKDALVPAQEIANAVKIQGEHLKAQEPIRAKIVELERQERLAQDDVAYGDKRRKADLDTIQAALRGARGELDRMATSQKADEASARSQLAARAGLARATSKLTSEEVKMFAEGRQAMDRAVADSVTKQKQLTLDQAKDDEKLSAERVSRFATYARAYNASSTDLITDEFSRRKSLVVAEAAMRTRQAQEEIHAGKVSADALVLIELEKENKIKKIDQDAAKAKLALQVTAANQVAGVFGQLADFMEKTGSHSFRAMKALRVAEATINTAAGVAQALGTIPPPYSYIAAAAVAAAGAIQVATILRTEPGSSGVGGSGIGSMGGSSPSTAGALSSGPSASSVTTSGGGGGVGTVNLYFEKESIVLQALSFDGLPPGAARRIGRDIVAAVSQQINAFGGSLR